MAVIPAFPASSGDELGRFIRTTYEIKKEDLTFDWSYHDKQGIWYSEDCWFHEVVVVVAAPQVDPANIVAEVLYKGQVFCFNCGLDGHWARDCKVGDWKNKCYRCVERGHIERGLF